MGSSEKVVNGVIWTAIYNVVNSIYGFIAVPLLINYFGKAEYGLIGLATSINVYIQLMDMGFNSTNVRFFSTWLSKGNHEKVVKIFQTSLSFYGLIGIINALILLIVSIFSGSIFNITPEQNIILKHLFYILAISAFINWYSSCFDQLIRATENVAWIYKRQLFPKLLMILVLGLTISLHLSIQVYYLLTCIAGFSIIPWSITKIKKVLPFISFVPKPDIEVLKEMLPYCLNIFSFSIFQFSFYNLRPVFLGIQGTVESVADYRILNALVGIVSMVGGTFMGSLLPSTSKVVANQNRDAYYKVAYQGTKYISILICFCCFGMMAVGSELLTIYVGKQYLYLIPWLNLWLICTLSTHNQSISTLILAGEDIRAISYSSAFASVVGLLIAWFTIPKYQIGGTVIAFFVYMMIQMLFYYLYYWPQKMHINSVRVLCRCFLPYVILGSACYLLIGHISIPVDNTWLLLFIKGSFFAIVFVIASWISLDKEDKSFFLSKVLKIKKR